MTPLFLCLFALTCFIVSCSASGSAHGPIQSFCHRQGDFGHHDNHHGNPDDHGNHGNSNGHAHGDAHANSQAEGHGNHGNDHGHAHGIGHANRPSMNVHLLIVISLVIGSVVCARQ
ncbi:hypothetical protein BsWGS_26948 [Bradybaena similaris]